MEWIKKIDKIVLLNLPTRTDRLLQCTELFEKYNIPFERVTAKHNTVSGAVGLRDTMIELFNREIEHGTESLLVFEDDVSFEEGQEIFHDTMNAVVQQLPPHYYMIFLGCQITGNITHFVSPNIMAATKMFATHAVLYSLQGMREVLSCDLQAPIDNDYVAKIEPMGKSFVIYPLLCSQRPDKSDIGGQFIDWRPFINDRYYQRLNQYRSR